MKNDKHTDRHSSAELTAMVEHGDSDSESDWDAVKALTDADVDAAVSTDPDEADLEIDWSQAVIHPESRKKIVTMRVDADVLAFFREQGRGYQTKINSVLRAYMDHARKEPDRPLKSGGTNSRRSS